MAGANVIYSLKASQNARDSGFHMHVCDSRFDLRPIHLDAIKVFLCSLGRLLAGACIEKLRLLDISLRAPNAGLTTTYIQGKTSIILYCTYSVGRLVFH